MYTCIFSAVTPCYCSLERNTETDTLELQKYSKQWGKSWCNFFFIVANQTGINVKLKFSYPGAFGSTNNISVDPLPIKKPTRTRLKWAKINV